MAKITKRTVDALEPAPDKVTERFVWDSELRGFGLRMMPSGVASYLVQYRTPEGRTRRLVIGKVGTLTPDEARHQAREKLRDAATGGDPSAERHKLRASIAVAELCDLFVDEAVGRVKPTTLALYKSLVKTHVRPLIGNQPVAGLTSEDVERFQADIAAGKTAVAPKRDKSGKRTGRGGIASGGRGAASRTVGMLGTILELARRRKIIAVNPVRGVERLPDGKQRRFLSLDELAALGKAMNEEEAAGENATALDAIRLLVMTGLRRMEALALPRAWVDGRLGCIRFEDTKSGAQLRPIGAAAVKLIEAQPIKVIDEKTGERSPWLFPAARGNGHLVGLPKALARVCDKAKIEGVTAHVLRHTFAAVAAELGYSELTIAGLLGHAVPGITARYAHVPDSALVSAANTVSANIAAALAGEAQKGDAENDEAQASNVVDMSKKRRRRA